MPAWAELPKGASPDVATVDHLLAAGQSPNQDVNGHSIWQYVLTYVHIVSNLGAVKTDVNARMQIFAAMLQHGADPYASCVEDIESLLIQLRCRKVDSWAHRSFRCQA